MYPVQYLSSEALCGLHVSSQMNLMPSCRVYLDILVECEHLSWRLHRQNGGLA